MRSTHRNSKLKSLLIEALEAIDPKSAPSKMDCFTALASYLHTETDELVEAATVQAWLDPATAEAPPEPLIVLVVEWLALRVRWLPERGLPWAAAVLSTLGKLDQDTIEGIGRSLGYKGITGDDNVTIRPGMLCEYAWSVRWAKAAIDHCMYAEAQAVLRYAILLHEQNAASSGKWREDGSHLLEKAHTPGLDDLYGALAVASAHQGSYLEALESLDKSLESALKSPTLSIHKSETELHAAGVALSRHNPQEAIAHCQKALTYHPESVHAYVRLSEAYADSEEYGQALIASQRACELGPNSAQAQVQKGYSLLRIGAYPEALAAASRLSERQSESPLR